MWSYGANWNVQRAKRKWCIDFIVDLFGGASRARTDDLIVANDALSQLSYSPTRRWVYFFDFISRRPIPPTHAILKSSRPYAASTARVSKRRSAAHLKSKAIIYW